MRTPRPLLPLAALLLAAPWGLLGSARAELVFFDDFDSAGATVGDDASDPTDIAWTPRQSNLSVGGNHFSPPRAFKNQGGSSYRYATGALPALQALDQPGDRLLLTMQFRTNNANGLNSRDVADGYRFGLFEPDDKGYFLNIAGGNDASDLSWQKDTTGDVHLAGSSGNTVLGSYGAGAPTIDDNTYDRLRLTFLRTHGGVSFGAEYADDQNTPPVTLTAGDGTSPITSFDRVLIGLGNHPIDHWMDDVRLEADPPMIPNGDFEAGNTGFATEYPLSAGHGGSPSLGIVSNPNDWFGPMGSFGDHTTGSGLMIVGDGGPTATNTVLEYTVPVAAGVPYRFTGYFAEAGGGTSVSQQAFDIRLDGVTLASLDLTGLSPGDWQEVSFRYDATDTNPLARLSIHALNTGGGGNNFVIDDVSFTVIPEPATVSLVALGGLGLLARRRRRR